MAREDTINTSAPIIPLALDESIQETLTEIALKPEATPSGLLRSLAEILSASGKGFAILEFQTKEQSQIVRTVFAPDGTSYLQGMPDSTSENHPIEFAIEVIQRLDLGEVLFFDALDSMLLDQASTHENILQRAFKDLPLLAIKLRWGRENEGLFLLAGAGLNKWHADDMRSTANKLSLAMEIVRMKGKLERVEAKHDRMFQVSEVALLLISPNGIVEELNTKAIQLFGLPRDESLGVQITQLIPELRDWYEVQQRRDHDSECPSLEIEFTTQDLGLRHLRLELLSLSIAEEGSKLLRITDLSEIWRLEEMVRRLDHMKDGMADHMSVGMFLQDAKGNFRTCEPGGFSDAGLRGSGALG